MKSDLLTSPDAVSDAVETAERLSPTLAVTTMAAERGVDVVRVHDVAENAAALRTVRATLNRGMST